MQPILYYSRNPNPRLAVATARHLQAPVTLEWAAPLAPGQAAKFLPLNPSLRLPILAEEGGPLWEADAIACRLSQMVSQPVGSEFFRSGRELPDLIRWVSWAKCNFMFACDIVHFERGTKQRYNLGAIDDGEVQRGLALFRESAQVLQQQLSRHDWLLPSGLSYADFRMAAFLPFNDVGRLPLDEFPAVAAWNERLMQIPAWADPFEGLDAPELPEVPA